MNKKKISLLILIILLGIPFITMKRTEAYTLDMPAQSGIYPVGASMNIETGEFEVTLSDDSLINFNTSVNTQKGISGDDYNYFVFPKVYADDAESYYSYIGTDNYKYILTGWKVDSLYQEYFGYTGSNITYYTEIGGYDAMWEPTVNVFGPDDYVDVSNLLLDNMNTVTFSPIYGKCIYINNPFENMYYDGNLYLSVLNPDELSDDANASNYIKNVLGFDSVSEYKEFLYYYTRNSVASEITGSETWKKYISFYDSSVTSKGYYYSPSYSNGYTGASDKNDGHNENNAVATMDRAYELVTKRSDFSPYHYVFYMLGNLHEIRVYNSSKQPSTNYNYSSGNYIYDATGTHTKEITVTGSDKNYFGGNNDRYKGVTITSSTGTRYNFTKRLATYGQYWYASIRFDNVNYKSLSRSDKEIGSNSFTGQIDFGSEETLNGRTSENQKIFQVCEFTRKSTTTGWSIFRVNTTKVVVLNSTSTSTLSVSYSWGGKISYLDETVYTIGGKQKISTFYGGSSSTNPTSIVTINGDLKINIQEEATISNFFGGSVNQRDQQTGNREINVRGGTISNLYGGGKQGILNGDIEINATSGKIGNLYGGGEAYMATVYGDIKLNLSNVNITGNVYGGGKYASVIQGYTGTLTLNSDNERVLTEKQRADNTSGGNVSINMANSTIGGSIYGSGQGMVNSVTKLVNYSSISYGTEFDAESLEEYIDYINNLLDNCDSNSSIAWWNDVLESPVVNDDGSITAYTYRQLSYKNPSTNSGRWLWIFYQYKQDYYLSIAEVQNCSINISDGTIVNGNVYGGGNLGVVEGNIDIEILEGSEVKGTLYGGGDGTANIANITLFNPYDGVLPKYVANGTSVNYENTNSITSGTQSTLAQSSSLGNFVWTNDIRLKNYSSFNGIYKGSSAYVLSELTEAERALVEEFGTNKYVYSPSYDEVGEVRGNIKVTINDANVGTLYGGCNRANVDGTIDLLINNATINSVYGGNNLGGVTGKDIKIQVGTLDEPVSIGNLFGAGNYARHNADTYVTINNLSGSMDYLFGGGYAADVNGSTNVIVNSGTYNYIFGGCDLAKVSGNTYLSIGDKVKNPIIKVNNIVYGGGRGVDSDGDGDASDFITVGGTSNVTIAGMNTLIENYGSTKLGSVAGEVNVTFDTYRRPNSTNPYIVMNGIDRATNVYLINSYIALENKGENGEKEGIKNIDNLSVPSGSGMMLAANGELKNNFYGGGYFYLDSKVSLIVGGDITGTTELVLNPQMAESEDGVDSPFVIKGSIDYAYLIVKGSSEKGNIVCTDPKYSSKLAYYHGALNNVTAGYYYLEENVEVDQLIEELLNSKKGINYTEDNSRWGDIEKVAVQQDGIFTTHISLDYNFGVTDDDLESYRNVVRSIEIKESALNGSIKAFPAGTRITMVISGDEYEYYEYTVNSSMSKIYLSDFTNMEDDTQKYTEVNDIVSDKNTIHQGNTINYTRSEDYRFVVDFTYCNDLLPVETYILYMNLEDNNENVDALSLLAENIVDLKSNRVYQVTFEKENRNYIERDIISFTAKINIPKVETTGMDRYVGLPLYARMSLKNENGESIEFLEGTVITFGDKEITAEGGVARFNLVDEITEAAYNAEKEITINMSALEEYSLNSGTYTYLFDIYLKDDVTQRTAVNEKVDIDVVRPDGATVKVEVSDNLEEPTNIGEDKVRNLKINYFGDVYAPYVKIKVQKENAGIYEDTNYVAVSNPRINNLEMGSDYETTLNFTNAPAGKYRVVFDVYGYSINIHYSTSGLEFKVE